METLDTNPNQSLISRKTKSYVTSGLFMVLFTFQAVAQVSVAEEQEKAAHNEFMSYVYMAVGFALVLFIAFYTTMKGKKDDSEDGGHKPPHNHHHHHSSGHKQDLLHGRKSHLGRR